MKRYTHLFRLLLRCSLASDQHTIRFQVMFWNVENLFDTRHDSLKNDYEFLPDAMRRWHVGRFKKKINDVARVIAAVGQGEMPDIVGLCEVENDYVLKNLTQYSALKEQGYRYVMTDSPDERGIDIALLYQRDRFRLLQHQSIRIIPDHEDRSPTRDILHVSGQLLSKDTLDVILAHFPSRSGGMKETEPYRLAAAKQLRTLVDSLFDSRCCPQILIMGDFNDYPNSKSITDILKTNLPADQLDSKQLYHLLARKAKKANYGSHKYRSEWKLLDHIIVSGNLLDMKSPLHTKEEKADVARLPFLLEEDTQYGGDRPFRTYRGMKYQGGFSDHLPVYVDFDLNVNY